MEYFVEVALDELTFSLIRAVTSFTRAVARQIAGMRSLCNMSDVPPDLSAPHSSPYWFMTTYYAP